MTDANGQAETWVRLQNAEGITLVRADCARRSRQYSGDLRAALGGFLARQLPEIPADRRQLGSGPATIAQKGALLTAAAAILRYHQNRGELGVPNGSADPAALNQFLANYCPTDARAQQVCDGFLAGSGRRRAGGESVARRGVHRRRRCRSRARRLPRRRSPTSWRRARPVLLSLALTRERRAGGRALRGGDRNRRRRLASRFRIPNPAVRPHRSGRLPERLHRRRRRLEGDVRGVARFALRSSGIHALPAGGALAAGGADADPWRPTSPRRPAPAGSLSSLRLGGCGGQPGGGRSAALPFPGLRRRAARLPDFRSEPGSRIGYKSTDLAPGGSRERPFGQRGRPPGRQPASSSIWRWRPKTASFTAAGVVNAATFTPGIAPGGLMSIFGTGLSGAGKATTVDMDGTPLRLSCSPPRFRSMRRCRWRWPQACTLYGCSQFMDRRSSK